MFRLKLRQKFLKIKKICRSVLYGIAGIIIIPIATIVAIPKRIALLRHKNEQETKFIKDVIRGSERISFFPEDYGRKENAMLIHSRIPIFILALQNEYSATFKNILIGVTLGTSIATIVLFPWLTLKKVLALIPFTFGITGLATTMVCSAAFILVYPVFYYKNPNCVAITLNYLDIRRLFNKSLRSNNDEFILTKVMNSIDLFQVENQKAIHALMKDCLKAKLECEINNYLKIKASKVLDVLYQNTPLPKTVLEIILSFHLLSNQYSDYAEAARHSPLKRLEQSSNLNDSSMVKPRSYLSSACNTPLLWLRGNRKSAGGTDNRISALDNDLKSAKMKKKEN